jgi:hypothetical protein
MEALAQSIIPLIGGILATVQVELPLMCASCIGILVVGLFFSQQRQYILS